MKKILFLLTIVSTLLTLFVSCQKINGPELPKDRLKGILLSDTLNMYVGEKRQLPLALSPSDYNIDSLRWKSSDTTVIAISTTGLISAKKVGLSTISVSNLSNTISASALVTVKPIDSLKIGLIAYYPFKNSAIDSSGHGNDGAAYNVTATNDRNGKANSAYYFDGISSYITVPDNPELRLGNTDFTINTWVKIASYNTSYGSVIMDKRGPGSSNGWNFGIAGYGDLTNYINAFGVVTYSVSGGNDPYIAGKMQVDTTKWHMTTVLYNASKQQVSVYIDGTLDNIAINIPSPNAFGSADIFIGKDNPAVYNGYYFKGIIDDIRIYKRTLSTSEIKKLFVLIN